jgi:2-polyprenyl-3-methyl-5-hydroxy-6-metoxy-1,4-benzoquinol methylase
MADSSIYDDGTYLERHPTWHAEDSAWKATQILRMMRQNRLEPHTICEIGCGAGDVVLSLADELGQDVSFTGYEVSPQAYELCRPKERPNVRFRLGNVLEETEKTFDLVLMIDVVEHVEDYFGLLRDARPRGRHAIFHIPLELSVQTVLRGSTMLENRATNGHIQYFSKETALATIADTGYEVIDAFYTKGTIELPVGGMARWLKWPRQLLFSLDEDLAARVLGGFSLLVLAK